MYNDRMERAFVVDAVKDAVGQIEKNGEAAFPLFHDPTGPFLAKDAYIFVFDMNGVNLVLPAFPNLEGRNLLDLKDTQGKQLIREMLEVVQTSGSGWVDYMWPKPGESVPTQKSAYVSKAKMGDQGVLVGCGVYLADAPKATRRRREDDRSGTDDAGPEGGGRLRKTGREGLSRVSQEGIQSGSVTTPTSLSGRMDGTRVFHAANPAGEGRNVSDLKDVLGRPIGKMFLEAVSSPSGEGWVHYMYPEPGNIFPTWKSTFVKRVTFPSGKQYHHRLRHLQHADGQGLHRGCGESCGRSRRRAGEGSLRPVAGQNGSLSLHGHLRVRRRPRWHRVGESGPPQPWKEEPHRPERSEGEGGGSGGNLPLP